MPATMPFTINYTAWLELLPLSVGNGEITIALPEAVKTD